MPVQLPIRRKSISVTIALAQSRRAVERLAEEGVTAVVLPPLNYGLTNFTDGFAGRKPLMSPGDARHRPSGIAEGPDGSLYIADDRGGRIWRVLYRGS